MMKDIKIVAVDVDGTFVRDDYSYDKQLFLKILEKMQENGCHFVVASGNQYYQLRDLFPGYDEQMAFIAENGAYIKDKTETVFVADIPRAAVLRTIDVCHRYPEIHNVMCGEKSAYCESGTMSQEFYDLTAVYYHRLMWVDDFKQVDDRILKFGPTVPEERTDEFYELFSKELEGHLVPTTSGHGAIDLILPGCHKASGLAKLAERWHITPAQCAAFGDGGNDIEMLRYCKYSYAMANAPEDVKAAAANTCPSNNDDGVLKTLAELFEVNQ